jgi:hypothetical protein
LYQNRALKAKRNRILHNDLDVELKRLREKKKISVVQTEIGEEKKKQETKVSDNEEKKLKKEEKKQQKKLKKEEEKKQRLQAKLRKQEERWLRWGHTRKPNGLVLAIYALLDWFGDFAPMFKALSRGVGKGAKSSWGLLVEGTMTTINVLLVIGIIYVSVGHSYNMLLYAGASGNEALVMVAVFETVFVYCSVVIDYSNKKGIRNPWAWVGFIIGFFFVEISNFMGMANNWIGNAVGITLPILLLVMKKVLEWQYKKQPKKQKKERQKRQKKFSWCFWRSNNEKSNSNKSDEVKSNNIKSNNEKSNSNKSDEVKSNNIKSNNEKSNSNKSDEVKPNNIKSNNEKLNSNKSDEVKPNNIKSNNEKSNSSKSRKRKEIKEHVKRLIEKNEPFSSTTVAKEFNCSRSTAHLGIQEAKKELGIS